MTKRLESLRARMRKANMPPAATPAKGGPRILTFDIETLPGIVERFDLKPFYTSPDWVIVPTRVLCFAAKWYGEEEVFFHAAWEDDDQQSYADMARAAWDLFDQADVLVGWNSTRFDIKHFHSVFARTKLGPPSPSRSLDLMAVARKNFNEMSYSLNWFSREWLGDRKIKTDSKLWQDIRRGTEEEKAVAQAEMRKYNCLTPDHKVLTTDLRWVEIGSLCVGDHIVGFDEDLPAVGNGRRWRRSIVTSNRRVVNDVYCVTLSNGDQIKCTGDHKWLTTTGPGLGGKRWVQTAPEASSSEGGWLGLRPGHSTVHKYLNVMDEIQGKDAGWLAGMFDGEGSLSNRKLAGGFQISISQKKGPELDKIISLLDRYGIVHSDQLHKKDYFASRSNGRIKSTQPIGTVHVGKFLNQLEFLQKIRPERLVGNINWDTLPRMEGRNSCVGVEGVEYIGEQEVVVLETDTSTYVADGYAMHNCKDVVLTEKLLDEFRPWTGVNFALLDPDLDEFDRLTACPKCSSNNIQSRGKFYTASYAYDRFFCTDCGGWSRGKRMIYSVELRPI